MLVVGVSPTASMLGLLLVVHVARTGEMGNA
jgi:hypothetical protein